MLQGGLRGALNQSVLEASGPQAAKVERLWWLAFTIAAIVYVLTIGALWWAARRARRRELRGELLDDAYAEPRMTRGVTWATAATLVILLLFLGADLLVGRTLSPIPKKQPLTIEVTGHQWWWEVAYADTSPHGRFTTANEIHVPVGEPVLLVLEAQDVIHSIWVPNLAGKKDLIPGYTQSWWFQADTAGLYRGQCAEFCGLQHAKMAFHVVAESPERYARWVSRQQQPAVSSTDSVASRGRELFLTGSCAMCHSIEGTPAGSHVGPDLTHVATRLTVRASAPNSRGQLQGWVADPQGVKPGTRMPRIPLTADELEDLVSYLETLK